MGVEKKKRFSMDKLIQFGMTFMTKRGVPQYHASYGVFILGGIFHVTRK